MTQKKLDSVVEEAKTARVSEEYGLGNERWEMRPLSELMEPVLGKTPKRSKNEYWSGDIQWASAKDISQSETRHIYDTAENMTEAGKEASNAKILPEGTVVVIARGATMGRIAQLGEPMTFNQTCYGLNTNDELLDDYLYYVWQYVFGQVQAVSYGTVFDTITMKSFKDIEIPLPPLSIQKRISRTLTQVDDLIEVNLNNRYSLLDLSRSVYRELIGPNEGERGDEYEKLVDHSQVIYGYSFDSSKFNEDGEGTPVVRIRNLSDNRTETYTPEEYGEKYHINQGDLLVGMDGEFRPHIWTGREAALNQRVCKFVPNSDVNRLFLLHSLERPLSDLEQTKSGTTVIHLGKRDIDKITCPIPEEQIMEQFNSVTKPIHGRLINIGRQNISLRKLRDTLLPQLISGQVVLS